MIYANLNNSGEVEAVYAAKRATTTGTPPLLYSSKGYDLEDFLISGNTVQNGTPTPSNPVDVVGCGERTENLIDTNDPTARNNMYISSAGGGTIQVSSGWWVSGYIPIEQGERYTAKNVSAGYLFYSEKGGASTYVNSNPSYGFTVPDGINYVRVWGRKNSVMLVKGSTVPSFYVPYGYKIPITCGGVTQNIYLGEVSTTRNIKKLVLDGTENWILYDNNYFSDIIDNTAKQNNVCKCTHLISDGGVYVGSGTSRLKVYSSAVSSVAQNLDEWKAFLTNQYAADTPVTVWYVLAEPETAVVKEPLHKIGDYADTISLSQSSITVPTTAGINTITTETTVLPSSISVTTPEKEVAEVYAGINYQNPIYYKSRTLTGTLPLTFKGLGQPLKDYSIIGNAVQNGTPTPDDPVDVVGCGDRTENLFDATGGIKNARLLGDGSVNYVTGWSITKYIEINPDASYIISKTDVGNNSYNAFYDKDRVFISSIRSQGQTYRITPPVEAKFIRISYNVDPGTIMMNEGAALLPYEPYGYRIPINCRSENLLDPYADGWTLKAQLNTSGDIVQNINTIYTDVSPFIEIKPGKPYSVCNRNSGNQWRHCFYNSNKIFISSFPGYGTGDTDQTATAPANAKYLRCSILATSYSPQYRYTKAMVTQTASIPTTYIPYISETQNIYLSEPLRKIGDYADEIDFKAGTVTRRIKEIVLTGGETYLYSWGVISFSPLQSSLSSYGVKSLLCNQYKDVSNRNASQTSTVGNLSIFFLTSGRIAIKDTTNFNNTTWTLHVQEMYAAGTPVTIWYVLAEDQVESVILPQIPTISGQNTLTVETAVQPSSASITGHIKPTGYGQLLDMNGVDIQDSNGTPIFIQG